MLQSSGAFELADDRMERAVGMLRRAEIAQARVRLAGEMFHELRRQPRFADAGLAREQHDLTFARLRQRPSLRQQFKLLFPPDERRQFSGMERLEAALDQTRPQGSPGPRGPGDALEVLRAEVLQLEEIAEQAPRAFGDDHHVRLGDALKTGREVWRLADDAALLRFARTDQVADDDQPGRDADPGPQRKRRLERSHRRDQLQPARTARSASSSWACG